MTNPPTTWLNLQDGTAPVHGKLYRLKKHYYQLEPGEVVMPYMNICYSRYGSPEIRELTIGFLHPTGVETKNVVLVFAGETKWEDWLELVE